MRKHISRAATAVRCPALRIRIPCRICLFPLNLHEAGLSLTNINKSFGDTKGIHGVDLEVEAGEFTVFVGPSGCGKSTLLRMITGLESVTNGSVAIGGAEVTHSDPSDRGETMVFQSTRFIPICRSMTIWPSV